jgi:hypothetical protein
MDLLIFIRYPQIIGQNYFLNNIKKLFFLKLLKDYLKRIIIINFDLLFINH